MPNLTLDDLNAFTGSEQWTRHWMARNLIYSEGMAHVAEQAAAYWLLDAIASHEVANPELVAAKAADEDLDYMRFWTLTVMSNTSVALRLPASLAVTLTLTVPRRLGVPLKVRVVALKVSHDGKALPSARVAE